jgi:phosphomannomutase
MTLIKSISGIRGTIGGKAGDGLSPVDVMKYAIAYALWLKENVSKEAPKIVVGRDARVSGEMVQHLILGTLSGIGVNVINLDLATTPTVEMAVMDDHVDGGIIITASHNPRQWNALKLLNSKGEFLSDAEGKKILALAENENLFSDINFADVDKIGKIYHRENYTEIHIQQVLDLPLVDKKVIKDAKFKIVVDAVNSVGGLAIPELLNELGVKEVIELNCEPTGNFAHNPEPLPENLTEISQKVVETHAHLGFVVDPDVDRLAIVCEDGSMFGEEYTLVAVSDYILSKEKGNTVSNLSSSRALRDVTEKHGGKYFASAVGEVNVVEVMKQQNAVIGGEGNGGIIYPKLHYGRDALVGVALFLTHLAKSKLKCSELRKTYPNYFISKNKIQLTPAIPVDDILEKMAKKYTNTDASISTIDGVKIDFAEEWVHLRKSNTEPIIRIYAESKSPEKADQLAKKIMNEIQGLLK